MNSSALAGLPKGERVGLAIRFGARYNGTRGRASDAVPSQALPGNEWELNSARTVFRRRRATPGR